MPDSVADSTIFFSASVQVTVLLASVYEFLMLERAFLLTASITINLALWNVAESSSSSASIAETLAPFTFLAVSYKVVISSYRVSILLLTSSVKSLVVFKIVHSA